MADIGQVHLVSTDGGVRAEIAEAFAPETVIPHASVEAFREAVGGREDSYDGVAESDGGGSIVVLLDSAAGASPADVVDLCRAVSDRDMDAIPLFVESPESSAGSTGLVLRPVSVGPSIAAAEAATALDPEGPTWPPLELHHVLAFIAKIRHDINNPLTAAMAENQLLLMDFGEEGETGDSLTTIHRQLQRIQGLVQELGRVRRPPKPSS